MQTNACSMLQKEGSVDTAMTVREIVVDEGYYAECLFTGGQIQMM